MNGEWEAIVIGAGPAGMAAAATLAESGARTLLIDEQAAPGGQIYRAIERNAKNVRLSTILGEDYARGAAAAARLRVSGAELRFATAAWRIDAGVEVWTKTEGHVERLRAKTLVLASGAMERPVPIPGWTLPGVMTIGALQIALKASGLAPAGRLVLAGSGPLFYLFAAQCLQAGTDGMVLLDTAAAQNRIPALRHLPSALRGYGPRYLWKGIHLMAALRRSGVAIHRNVSDIRIEGEERATAVTFVTGRHTRRIDCDIVGLHEGVIPHQQMARSLGCSHDWDAAQHCFRPRRDRWGETTVDGIFIAGDGGGIIGAQASIHDGNIAALAILNRLGRLSAEERDRRYRTEARARAAHLTVRSFLDRLYLPRDEILDPADDTVVCRCECIKAGEIREVASTGCLGPNQTKAFLRSGMGPCQGRMCGPTVSEIIARSTNQTAAQTGYYRIRSPLKPVTVGELAAQFDREQQNDR